MNKVLLPFLTTLMAALLLTAKSAFALSIPVTEYTLANGLRVVVIEDHRAPLVLNAVVYTVGGADESPGKTGLAHFFEHLMFKGTTKYPKDSFDRLLDESGAERNAFTSLDTTVYYERASVTLLEQLIDLEADRMQNLVLNTDVLNTERKVVQEERRLRTDSDAMGTAIEKVYAIMFKAHPYGRPIVGWAADVAKLTIDDAMTFYRAHYMPSNAILLVVGDVVPADVQKLALKYFGPLQNLKSASQLLRPDEPAHNKAERLELEDARISDPIFSRIYNTGPNRKITAREAAAYSVLSSILGANSQSRLTKQLVTRSLIASDAGANFGGSTDDYGLFRIYATPRSGVDVLEVEQRVDAILADIKANGISAEELQNAKNTSEAKDIYMRDNPVGFGVAVAGVIAAGFKLSYVDDVHAALLKLTPEDIKRAAMTVLDPQQSVTLIMRPKH
jgi:zinc protease